MSSSHFTDDSDENPFEPPTGQIPEGAQVVESDATGAADRSLKIPRIERSYWIGISVLGAMGVVSYITSVVPDLLFLPTIIDVFVGIFLAVAGSISSLIPFALIRLALHRMHIARAIDSGTYPGHQRFDIMYLIYSIVLSWVSLLGGCTVFFGICTAVFFMGGALHRELNATEVAILGFDALLAIAVIGFLLNLGIPKYR